MKDQQSQPTDDTTMEKEDEDGRGTTRYGGDTGTVQVFVNDDVEGSQRFRVKHLPALTGASPPCEMRLGALVTHATAWILPLAEPQVRWDTFASGFTRTLS